MRRKDAKLVGKCFDCGGKIIVWLRGMKKLGPVENVKTMVSECPSCEGNVNMEIKSVMFSKTKGEISQAPI